MSFFETGKRPVCKAAGQLAVVQLVPNFFKCMCILLIIFFILLVGWGAVYMIW